MNDGQRPSASDAELTRLAHVAPIGLAVIAADGAIASANQTFADAFVRGGIASGRSLSDLLHGRDGARAAALLARAGVEPGVLPPAIEVRPKDAPDRTALIVARAEAASGRIVVAAIDVTEARRIERRLLVAEKLQTVSQLAAGIAHDFNNLLTSLVGSADLLLARFPEGNPAHEDVAQIRAAAERAKAMVHELLTFAGEKGDRPETLDVNAMVADVAPVLERVIGPDCALQLSLGPATPPVSIDRTQLEQTLVNLATNAREAMPEGGTFTVATTALDVTAGTELEPGLYAVIEVADTGRGMTEAQAERVFEPYFTTKGPVTGAGLGLAFVYGIVRRAGGTIEAKSKPGQGTSFTVLLPAVAPTAAAADAATPATAAAAAPPAPTPAATAPARPARVLIVEDEHAVRRFAVRALKSRGYEVVEAETGEDALALLNEPGRAVDLMVSDVMMPSMDGGTLVREARAKRPGLKIVLVSGYGASALRGILDQHADVEFLAKPFGLDELTAKVAEVLGRG
jgi:two-component system cell cycle sensor histidine kinase/response regulator CckA